MAFVHLHNHSEFSMLDAADKVGDLVGRAVDLGMEAIALTDHGYLYGMPDFDLACRAHNEAAADLKQWKSDCAALQAGEMPSEPEADATDAAPHARAHAQWERDIAAWQSSGQAAEALEATKPTPVIKPIFGCEAYFICDDCIEKKPPQHRYHLILLAKNEQGYINLMKMMSEAAIDQFYYKPRTTLEMLKRYHEGIICCSACVQGIVPQYLLDNNPAEAEKWARIYQDIFGEDFYIEIQDHGLVHRSGAWTDRTLSEALVELAQRIGAKVVATNDVHYLTREDARIQDVLSCIGTANKLTETNRKHMDGTEFYLKSEQEMRELFAWCPEALDNTLEVANKCSYELDWTHMYLPKFPDLAPGETSEQRFRTECERGLAKRYGADWRNVEIEGINVSERFEYEYKVICDKGFADYFLIVQEYVQWAKDNGIGVGPGRGSAAGAIVAYALNITTFDPLENGLMFERFLSPERSEMPDIDMDFDDERRLEVIQHVRELYGSDRVCHVITYSTIKARQAINDAARVLDQPVFVGQRLSKMLSSDPSLKLENALVRSDKHPEQFSPDFAEAYEKDSSNHEIIDTARSIEGLLRGEGVHACAVLITPTPVNDHVPTKLDTKGGVEITQYEGHTIADMGLLKMDFLGLRTLTVISKALSNIRANYATPEDVARMPEAVRSTIKPGATCVDIDVDAIPFDDPKIFELMGRGDTAGVFQIESAGMTATIKNMQPTEYKQVTALIALYRPGPLGAGMVTSYIRRMNGQEPVTYPDPRLQDILGETYGTIVYQEQVMQISIQMCGFSAGESDSRVRKPVAKKKIKLLTTTVFHWENGKDETTYDHWMNGAEERGYSREVAQTIWDQVLEFASYAFNKSHSAGYAILVMQTAWLKAYFPREYMASVLTSYMGKTEKIVHYISACHREGIDILPPDVNESRRDFTAVPEGIRFGFAGIRGVGEGAADAIIAEREEGGPFENLYDFVDRVDASVCNRRVVEALIKAGAFDSTGYPRMQLMQLVDKDNPGNILDAASKRQKDRAAGQSSFSDMFAGGDDAGFGWAVCEPSDQEWDRRIKLAQEKDVLGIYVSDHPLRPYEYALAQVRDCTIADLSAETQDVDPASEASYTRQKVADGANVWLAGMVSQIDNKMTKKGDPMALVTLADMGGEVTCVVFPKAYKKYINVLRGQDGDATGGGDVFVRVHGRVERDDRGIQLIVSEVEPIDLSKQELRPKVFEVLARAGTFTRELVERLSDIFVRHAGYDRVELRVEGPTGETMRIELPVQVDARSLLLKAEVLDLMDGAGQVLVA